MLKSICLYVVVLLFHPFISFYRASKCNKQYDLGRWTEYILLGAAGVSVLGMSMLGYMRGGLPFVILGIIGTLAYLFLGIAQIQLDRQVRE